MPSAILKNTFYRPDGKEITSIPDKADFLCGVVAITIKLYLGLEGDGDEVYETHLQVHQRVQEILKQLDDPSMDANVRCLLKQLIKDNKECCTTPFPSEQDVKDDCRAVMDRLASCLVDARSVLNVDSESLS